MVVNSVESALKTKEKLIMSNNLIGTEPGRILALLADITLKARSGAISADYLDLLAKGQLVPAPGVKMAESCDPLDMLVSKIERKLSRKLGRHVVPYQLPQIVTVENLEKWAAFNAQPIFLPELDLTEDARLPKRWVRLGATFYQWLREGKIGEAIPGVPPTRLRAGWYLADFSVGPDYTDGTQVFPSDPWTPLLERLRRENLVGKHDETPMGSRFAITHDEWTQVVLVHMASKLGFPAANVRLERASEFNAIGNLYDPNRGAHNMWVWLADPFGDSNRLIGGHRGNGGLASIDYSWRDDRSRSIAARPLVVL